MSNQSNRETAEDVGVRKRNKPKKSRRLRSVGYPNNRTNHPWLPAALVCCCYIFVTFFRVHLCGFSLFLEPWSIARTWNSNSFKRSWSCWRQKNIATHYCNTNLVLPRHALWTTACYWRQPAYYCNWSNRKKRSWWISDAGHLEWIQDCLLVREASYRPMSIDDWKAKGFFLLPILGHASMFGLFPKEYSMS